jgi:alkanesulfonate monooxygenase SsuD/methylene tetrahydromethanopterin reductase-like flavin-dependent oxidoreductase (luciferase family)
MKYGLYLPNFGGFGDALTMASLARQAEGAGWDGFFIWDHINRDFKTPVVDPWIALSAVAVSTQILRIGALVTPLARRRPWKVARETVSLDRLCNGRLIMGVGLGSSGGTEVEWSSFGEELDLKARGEMLDEGLDILSGLWTGKPFGYTGRHYQVKEVQFLPPPLQAPRIPIWVAGNWPARPPFRRAARWDGMIPQMRAAEGDELTQLKQAVEFTRVERSAAGITRPYEIVYSTAPTPVGEPGRAAERIGPYAEAGVTWWLEQLNPQHFGRDWSEEWPMEAIRRKILAGPPAFY